MSMEEDKETILRQLEELNHKIVRTFNPFKLLKLSMEKDSLKGELRRINNELHKQHQLKERTKIRISNIHAHVEAGDFMGVYSKSADGRFVVACEEGDSHQRKRGTCILGEDGYVITRKKLERPNDGSVANNGNFVVNDWLFDGQRMGIFYAFDMSGKKLIRRVLDANPHNTGISDDGRLATCQVCMSDTDDSSKLFLFDLSRKKLVWSIVPDTGWADSYDFDTENDIVHLLYENSEPCGYDAKGNIIDYDGWVIRVVRNGELYSKVDAARGYLEKHNGQIPADLCGEFVQNISASLATYTPDHHDLRPTVYRLLGELHEGVDDPRRAVENYEKALELDPKIGVRRKLQTLKKRL